MVSERDLVAANLRINDLQAQVTRLQEASTAELLKHRETVALLKDRIAAQELREKSHLSELADYGRTTERLNRAVAAVREYFDDHEDVIDGNNGPAPNWAMTGSELLGDALAGKGVK